MRAVALHVSYCLLVYWFVSDLPSSLDHWGCCFTAG